MFISKLGSGFLYHEGELKMKYCFALFAIVGMAFASSTLDSPTMEGVSGGEGGYFPGTDDYFESYIYDATVCSSIPASANDYRVVDDFQPTVDVTMTQFSYYGITTGATPSALELMYFANNAGAPGDEVSQTSYPVTTTNTGFTFAGYIVWKADMVVDLDLSAGIYWFGFHRNDGGDNWFVGIGPCITGYEAYRTLAAGYTWAPMSASIQGADLFKELQGTPQGALLQSTWAGIKTQF